MIQTIKCKNQKKEKLPSFLRLSNPFPGEPPFMKKRKKPSVLRFHKFKMDTHYNEYFFSQALLYHSFESEEELESKIVNLDENGRISF